MEGVHLPATLAAVSVSVVGGHGEPPPPLPLANLVSLFSQVAPVFEALSVYEASTAHSTPAEAALLIFYDQRAALEAVRLLSGYPLGGSAFSLHVSPAERQPLQRLAQVLVKCMAGAAFSPDSRSQSPALPAAATASGLQPPGWPPAQQQQQQHSDLAAAAASAWGKPALSPGVTGLAAMPPAPAPPIPTSAPAAPWEATGPVAGRAGQPGEGSAWGTQRPGLLPSQSGRDAFQQQQLQPVAGPPALSEDGEASAGAGMRPPDLASALRRQQEEFLARQRAASAQQGAAGAPAPAPAPASAATPAASAQAPRPVGYAAVAAGRAPAPAQGAGEPQRLAQALEGSLAVGEAADANGWEEDTAGAADSGGGLGRKLFVSNVRPEVKASQIQAVFARYGKVEEVAKAAEASHAFVTFRTTQQAAAAFAHLNEEKVPSLCGDSALWIEFREAPAPSAAGAAGALPGAKKVPAAGKPQAAGYRAAAGEGSSSSRAGSSGQQRRHEEEADHPTTKLWVGGICGEANEDTLKRIFGKFGVVYGIELRAAPEPGRRDQWAFVNFRREADCIKAREELVDRVIPDLTGTMRLKLRYKEPGTGPHDRKRPGR